MDLLKPFGPAAAGSLLRASVGDRNLDVARTLAEAFAGVADVEVVHGDLLDVDADAIVSAGNSFGDMGGGIDKAIDDLHEGAAQRAIGAAIAETFLGELPVGMGLVVELPGRRFPFVVAAPTMRVPGPVMRTLNAYLAMRGALVAVLRHNASGRRPIRTVAVPGLGTGVGGMAFGDAARQMRAAWDGVVGGGWRRVVHPAMAPFAMPF